MKKTLIFLACFVFVAQLSACSWMKSKDETESADVAETTESIDNELEKVDEGDAALAATEEPLPENSLGDQATTTNEDPAASADPTAAPAASGDQTNTAATEQTPAPDNTAGVDPGDTTVAQQEAPAPTTESAAPIEAPADPTISATPPTDVAPAAVAAASTSTEEKPKPASLKKVELVPFERGGQLLNTVFIARPKDTYKSIAKVIYGDDKKAKDLKKANPSISNVRPGDKIYYNSPQRPQDNSRIITYYEDQGIAPEIYVTKEGDDIKKVSKELLGYNNAWKEVWVTNSVESKTTLPAGTELRYWKAAPAAPPAQTEVAKVEAAPEPVIEPSQQMAAAPPPPTPDLPPMPEAAPPPPPPQAAAPVEPQPPAMQPDIPPPPPPADMAPPPVAKKAPKKIMQEEPAEGMDSDLMMSLGGAAIAAAGLAAFIVIRKRRQQKEMASAFNDTQVGT